LEPLLSCELPETFSKVRADGVRDMNVSRMTGVYEAEQGVRKIEISFKRVAEWVLIFTNFFYLSYFMSKWLKIL
jgi:hypothetical protein